MDWKLEESNLNSRRAEIIVLATASRFDLRHQASHPVGIIGPLSAVKRIEQTNNPSIPQCRDALLFLCTSQIAWFLTSSLKHSGYYTYRQFDIQQLYVLPTQCIYVFSTDLRTESDYFPIQL
jgi:hypothetical protein